MRKLLINLFKAIGLHFKKKSFSDAVKDADKMNLKTGRKSLVFYSGGEFKVVTKKTIREAKKRGFFKGESYADIERRALYVK